MTPGVPTKVIAASCGLTAFAVAMIAGLAADNPAESILARALVGMIVCQIVGWGVGAIGERTVRDAFAAYQKSNAVDNKSRVGASAPSSNTDKDGVPVV